MPRGVLPISGARFEMRTSLQVSGEFTVAGDDFEAVRHSLEERLFSRAGRASLMPAALIRSIAGPVRWARDSGHFVDWPDVFQFQRLDARFDVIRGLDDTRFSLEFENMSLKGGGAIDFFTSEMDYAFELRFASGERAGHLSRGRICGGYPLAYSLRRLLRRTAALRLHHDALVDLARRLIERDAEDLLSRLFGE